MKKIGIEGDELFALDARGAEIVQEEGKDACVRLNCRGEVRKNPMRWSCGSEVCSSCMRPKVHQLCSD